MSLVDLVLHPLRHSATGPVRGWPDHVRRSPAGDLVVAGRPVGELAQHRAGAGIAVPGGTLLLARVVRVRHDPDGSVVALAGQCPVPPERHLTVTLAEREPRGPVLAMSLRWGGEHDPTSGRLPVDVAQGDLMAVWLPDRGERDCESAEPARGRPRSMNRPADHQGGQ